MIDQIARALVPQKASIEPQKAVTGSGAAVMSWGIPISDVTRNHHTTMREAQAVYSRGNRWVKRAEMVISNRVGGVPWHLETADGETITDESPEELRQIRDLLEKPIEDEFAKAFPHQPATRRSMWGLTSRHMGLCNVGFWHLDEINTFGWPKRTFFIRPDRLTPEETQGRLTGWTLDKDQNGGTSLSVEEVLPFYLDQPDKGYFGSGLVESVAATLGLPSAIDRHAIDTLQSGGRLPGIYSPKETGTGDDVFNRMITDLRTIKDMPDSSKRDIVARAPIEFTPTAADMGSLVVDLLSKMSRDDTLTHWGVPLSTIGGSSPAGMNSGETRKYDEAALWQNAVGFRIDGIKETLQLRFLDRLKAVGIDVTLVIEEPAFDDDEPRYQLLNMSQNLPMTNKERRAIIGLDPFGIDALDNAIVMPMQIVEYGTSVSSRPADDEPLEGVTAKASLAGTRRAAAKLLPRLEREVNAYLRDQRREISAKVQAKAEHLAKKPGDEYVWWNAKQWDERLEKLLAPYAKTIADLAAEGAKPAGKAGFTDLAGNRVLQSLITRLGKRIRGINETTREAVSKAIREGVEAGDGAAQLGDRIEALAGFDEYRAELIARTESARVLNEAQIESFREYGVQKVRAIDGDDDPECAARDGQVYDLEDALSISDHPNGTLDWSPVV